MAKSLVVAGQDESVPPDHTGASPRTEQVPVTYYDQLDSRVRAVEREMDALERCLDGFGRRPADERARGITARLCDCAHRAVQPPLGIVCRMTAQVRNLVTRQ